MNAPSPRPYDRQQLVDGVALANLPTLLMVLFHLTGDQKWLRDPYRPQRGKGIADNDSGGFETDVQEEVRAAAVEALLAWGEGEDVAVDVPDEETFVEMMSSCMGEPIGPEFAPMMIESLQGNPRKPYAAPASDEPFSVVVIGAGISGLSAGIELLAAGIEFTILEKSEDVGGTWFENRYPGAGVDTPSYVYSFSHFPRRWSTFFGKRPEVHEYIRALAEARGLLPHIRFGVEVERASYDEDTQMWTVVGRTMDGEEQVARANAVITAVGQLNRPAVPDIPGAESFRGDAFHSAKWPEGYDVDGKRVAVVGTGASAMQIVPAVVDRVEHLTVVQRSPQWVAPSNNYFSKVPGSVHWLMENVPYYEVWYRLRLAWITNDRVHPSLQIDPEWEHPERSLNKINDGHRRFFTDYLMRELEGRQDLIDKSLPTYPPFGKRMLLDNGWYAAIRRDDVDLVVDGIDHMDETGFTTSDGVHHDVDVVVFATGFQAKRQLYPMDITGRDGTTIRGTWGDEDAKAYLGMTVPGFPNLFVMYGPNLNLGHGGSYMYFGERQARWIVELLATMRARGLGSVEVRADVHDDYNRRVDEAHAKMIWSHRGMDTWYRNAAGRVVTNSPWRVVDYWAMTKEVDLDEFEVQPAVRASLSGRSPA